MAVDAKITAIIVTYAPESDVLNVCIQSLRDQTPAPEIIIVDNLAPSDPEHKIAKSFSAQDVAIIPVNRNSGFGGAINIALRTIDTQYILISNYDIVYNREYISTALARLESSGNDVVGIAGKTLFYPPGGDPGWPGLGPDDPPLAIGHGTGGVIDNTGTLVNGLMLAYNRGVGQIDIGQYDISDQPMGACFAAFLSRTSAFIKPGNKSGDVGLLDAGFFMYYEDIDWCYRANLKGFKIIYEPRAYAWHHHSLTTRDKSLFFKYHLIQRNLYRTIIKNMRFRTFIKLWLLHARLHIRRARIENEFWPVTIKILLETIAYKPAGLTKRISVQRNRKVSDTDIINLSIGEEGHLDDVTLRPQADWHNVLASLERLKRVYPDDPALALIPLIEQLESNTRDTKLSEQCLELARSSCPTVVPLIEHII
jgi:GT2 family glycosyltransferase